MSEHIHELLGAYLDGELHGGQLRKVQAHLEECQVCLEEYQALQALSVTLQDAALPEIPSPERFTAQVALRLPRAPEKPMGHRVLEFGWWLTPVGLILAWTFLSTTLLLSDVITTAGRLGLLSSASIWLASGAGAEAYWTGTLGQLGLLAGDTLQWMELTEIFSRTALPQLIWQASIALLYLSWMAVWWARHARLGQTRPLDSGSRPTMQ
jgi:predicted anti-sigma-YlaC factor YlaD